MLLVAASIAVVVAPDRRAAAGVWKAFFLEPALAAYVLADVLRSRFEIEKFIGGFFIGGIIVSVFNLLFFLFAAATGWPHPCRAAPGRHLQHAQRDRALPRPAAGACRRDAALRQPLGTAAGRRLRPLRRPRRCPELLARRLALGSWLGCCSWGGTRAAACSRPARSRLPLARGSSSPRCATGCSTSSTRATHTTASPAAIACGARPSR